MNEDIGFEHIVHAYCTGKATAPFYYIVVLVQLTILTPLIVKAKDTRWMYLVTPVYLLGLYIINISTGEVPRLYETIFPAWFGFYIFGMDCRKGKWDNSAKRVQGYWIAVALGSSIIEALVLLEVGGAIGFVCSQIRFGSFLYAGIIALVLIKKHETIEEWGTEQGGRIRRLIVSVGNYSYGIFYVHMFALMTAQKLVSMTGMGRIWILNFLVCFVLTTVSSYLIVWGFRKVSKKLKIEKILRVIGF